MNSHWRLLAVVCLARLAMGAQFERVGALSPELMAWWDADLADVGLLIGLYLAPGMVFAIPGGAIGRIIGDRRAACAALAVAAVGAALVATSTNWNVQVAGRILAGAGAAVLNVVLTKMLVDAFTDRGLAMAMGLFVTSWPAGIGLGAVALPPVSQAAGLSAASWAVALLLLTALAAVAAAQLPRAERSVPDASGSWPRGPALAGVLLAGMIWGLMAFAFSIPAGFGVAMLTERGWSTTAAGWATSLALWPHLLSVPLGGWLVDRAQRRDTIILMSVAAYAMTLPLATQPGFETTAFIASACLGGLGAGAVVSLSAATLTPRTRPLGMGLFYTVYYACMLLGPAAAGRVAAAFGGAAYAFLFGGALVALCAPALLLHARSVNLSASRHAAPAPAPSALAQESSSG